MTKTINWTVPKMRRLRAAYNAAVNESAEEFEFEGEIYVTGFAKYLLQHLNNEFYGTDSTDASSASGELLID